MFQLQAPHPLLQTTALLPDPQFSDQEAVLDTVTRKSAMDGTRYTYVKRRGGRRKLRWVFQLSRNKGLELRAFLQSYFASATPGAGSQRPDLGRQLHEQPLRVRHHGYGPSGDRADAPRRIAANRHRVRGSGTIMVRTISSNALTTLAKRLGNEPIVIVEVDWADAIVPRRYADRTIPNGADTILGRIVEVSDVDDSIDITTYNNTSKQVSVTLDDTDGSIKALFDGHDSHLRRVRVYQWFTGLDLSDMFLVFSGRINTPLSWSERDRTIKITAISQIEDMEIGFSAEEGNFPYVPSDLVGRAWPMVFGTVYDYPAVWVPFAAKA